MARCAPPACGNTCIMDFMFVNLTSSNILYMSLCTCKHTLHSLTLKLHSDVKYVVMVKRHVAHFALRESGDDSLRILTLVA